MVTIKKLFGLIILPIFIITIDIILITCDGAMEEISSIGMILLAVLHLGIMFGMYITYNSNRIHRFRIALEKMPMICFGLGYEDGIIYVVLPFVTIAFGWEERGFTDVIK